MEMKYKSSENPEVEAEDPVGFDKSLQELRELRSQLHYAADYCETTFLKAKEKKDVMENTKEYLCRAVVTVVDHLGSVSANLECLVSQTNAFSEAELRINCLKQRLQSCEQYVHKLAFRKVQWSENLPRFHSRYLSAPSSLTFERSNNKELRFGLCRDSTNKTPSKIIDKHVVEAEEDVPRFLYTYTPVPSLVKNLTGRRTSVEGDTNSVLVIPGRNGLSVLSKGSNPTFQFQMPQKVGRNRKSLHSNDFLSLIRLTKRTP
ncbi:ABIL1-like protein [Quillaja saponaria]|uniref:ABIL1-like protein n=1 Tax=Quillaja saponaria TaxID=32244 RepID=A0AAD7M6D7_QUISA|nr:ABIL1-like protein [Quillaja saponaria]